MFCPAACRNVWKVLNFPQESILANTSEMHNREGEVGYSTNGYKVIDYLVDNNIKIDQIKNIEI